MSENEPKIKILVTYKNEHKILKSDILTPIQTGRAIAEKNFEGMIGDDTGDNISDRNNKYSEVSAQYWAWKNQDKLDNPDYIGFMHYRRHFVFNNKELTRNILGLVEFEKADEIYQKEINLNDDGIVSFIKDYDVVVCKEVDLIPISKALNNPLVECPRGAFDVNTHLYAKDYDLMLSIVLELYPEYKDIVEKHELGHIQHWYNMFIMKKDLFDRYNEFAFPILFELEKQIDTINYSEASLRILGYLSERLLTLFVLKLESENSHKIKKANATFINDTSDEKLLLPKFTKDSALIILSSSDYFVPYLATTLQSIIDSSNKIHNYDFVIFTKDMSDKNKALLEKYFASENISLRFITIKNDFDQLALSTPGHVSRETYFKLVAPVYLKNYKKCLFLDADVIVKEDLYNLYQTDVGGYPLAAVASCVYAGILNSHQDIMDYTQNILKLEKPYKYFQGGILLINIEEFNKNAYSQKLLDKASSYEYKCADQCLLNSFFKDNIKYIDNAWNFETCQKCFSETNPNMPLEIKEKYNQARKAPKIVHYAGHEKPWIFPEEEMADIWWAYARKTPFYEVILKRMSIGFVHDPLPTLLDVVNYKENCLTYWRYKILSKIKLGKKRQHYKEKREIVKQKLRNARAILNR